jgi:4-amino-4-deoxy-L-arabinose transferase-like glycosyltransferase
MFLLIMRLPEGGGTAPATGPWWRRALPTMFRPFAPGHFLRTAWSMRPVTAVVVVLLVAAPWYVMVARRTDGAWTRGFFLEHNVGRSIHAMEGHGGSAAVYPFMVLFYYPAITLAFFLPWSILIVPIVIDLVARIRRRHPWYAGYVFAACWAGVVIGIFSIPRTKLPSYSTPMYPALALVAGAFLYHWTRGAQLARMKTITDALRLLLLLSAGAVVAMVGFAVLYHAGALPGPRDGTGVMALAGTLSTAPAVLAVGAVAAAGAGCVLRLLNRGRLRSAAVGYGVMAVVLMTAAHGFVTVCLDRQQQSHKLLAAARSRNPSPRIATFNRIEPSWVYYARQTLPRFRRPEEVRAFLATGDDAFVITDDEHIVDLEPALPPGVGVLETVPYFGRQGRLVVVGHKGEIGLPETASGGS